MTDRDVRPKALALPHNDLDCKARAKAGKKIHVCISVECRAGSVSVF